MIESSNQLKKIYDIYKYSILVYDQDVISGEKVKKYETDHFAYWMIDPNESYTNVECFSKLDNKTHNVWEKPGIWSCIVKDKRTNNFRAISSINNELPWYYSSKFPKIISNNLFLFLKATGLKQVNFDAVSSFLALDWCLGGETFIKDIKKSYGGDIIYLDENKLKIVSIILEDWLGFDDSIIDINLLVDRFIEVISDSLKHPNAQLTLTAGKDSRTILAGALKSGRNFSLMTGVPPSTSKLDIKIPIKIAKILNIKHDLIDESSKEIIDLNSMLDHLTLETNAEYSPRKWINFYKEYVRGDYTSKDILRLMGYGGEIFSGFYNDVMKKISWKTQFLELKSKEAVCELANQLLTRYRNISPDNSRDLFYQRERDHFWVGANIRAMINYTKIFTPFKDPSVLAIGYRMQGGIRNCKIHKNMINILPDKLSKIPTNGNKLFNLLKKLQNKVYRRKNINLSLETSFIINNLDYDLFTNIISHEKIKKMLLLYEATGTYDEILHKMVAINRFFTLVNKNE